MNILASRVWPQIFQRFLDSEFAAELIWQSRLSIRNLTERDFLSEYAWVVINSGFKESIARRVFPYISLCFFDFESANVIAENGKDCVKLGSFRFGNIKKLESIVLTAKAVERDGFYPFLERVLREPKECLSELPFIGPVTVFHLMKNIGFNISKPDRHLLRIADRFGYSCVESMCKDLAKISSVEERQVDLVLWRASEQGWLTS